MRFPFWRRQRRDEELNEEIQGHLTLAEREEMESGQTKSRAQAAAHQEFGNVTLAEEVTRDMWGWRWLMDLLQDVRYGLRMLRMNPGFTTVAVLTLALGIGANTAIFSLIDAVMLRMLPVQKPEELVLIGSNSPKDTEMNPAFTNPMWEQIRDRQDVFSGIFAFSSLWKFDLSEGGESQNVDSLYVSGDFFHTLGVRPAAGRLLTTSDDVRGCPGAVVLSHSFWQDHYASDPNVIGTMLRLEGHSLPIVGVTAPGFFGLNVGKNFDIALPLCSEAITSTSGFSKLDTRIAWWLSIMARPKPGMSLEKIRARLQVLSPQIFNATIPQKWEGDQKNNFINNTLFALPSANGYSNLREAYDAPLRMLMGVTGLVLLIACANIASLMLARATARRREIGVRLALGASRFRLIRQLLTESILLSSAGALLGVLFARWGCVLLVRFLSTTGHPVFLQMSMDSQVLGFTAGIAILTGLFFGLMPALRSTRISLSASMKGGHTDEREGYSRFRPGQWIITVQVALSLILVIVSGLFLRSLNNLLTLDTGFDRNNVLIVSASERNLKVPGPEELAALNQQILSRLRSLPGAISASESIVTPISDSYWNFNADPYSGMDTKNQVLAHFNYVSPSYFATLRTSILIGRDFKEDDSNAPNVAVINETMARKIFHDQSPIGKYVHNDMPGIEEPPMQIIGVVKDAKYGSIHEDAPPTIYFPLVQFPVGEPLFEIRTASRPSSLIRPAEEAILGINKGVSLEFRTLEDQVGDSLRQDQLLATLSGFFGGLALLLAMIGLYGVLAYMVTQRRKEIGIRMALGAGRESILWLVLRDVSILLLVGISAGIAVSLWATQFLQKMLFELKARDTKTIVGSAAILAIVALFAGYLPARRASRLNPMAILRDE